MFEQQFFKVVKKEDLILLMLDQQIRHCVKSVQVRSFFWSVFSPNTKKYGPEITLYLNTFHAVWFYKIHFFHTFRYIGEPEWQQ